MIGGHISFLVGKHMEYLNNFVKIIKQYNKSDVPANGKSGMKSVASSSDDDRIFKYKIDNANETREELNELKEHAQVKHLYDNVNE